MRTLNSTIRAQIELAKKEIAKYEDLIKEAQKNINIDADIDDYRRASTNIDITKQSLNYYKGVLIIAQQVIDYTDNYIEQEEADFEEMMNSVPTTI